MFSIKKLYELQELDGQISSLEKSLAEVRAKLADDSTIISARAELELLQSQLAERTAARRGVEPILQELEDKLKAADKRLYGGFITGQRELSAHEEERSFLQKQRDAEEEKLLALMVELEDLESGCRQAQQRRSRLEAERQVQVAELSNTERRLVAELEEMRPARADVVQQIPTAAYSTYELLRKDRNGYAVAKVERGLCQGCRLALPSAELQRVRVSQGIVHCNSCRRILYLA